jgi:hypothetical protein
MPSDKTTAPKQTPVFPPLAFGADWMKSLSDTPMRLCDEMLSFTAKRLRAQADHMQSLAKCRNPSEILERQTAFFRGAMEDYSSEATKSAKLMQEAAQVPPQVPPQA